MYKYVLAVLTLLVLATPVYADNYEINGSVVYINDSNVLLEAFPHTIIDSGYVTFNLTTKWYDGDIDAIWGFNSKGAMPKTGELLKPHNVTEQKSYTCDAPYWHNYTTTPKHFYCWQDEIICVPDDETNTTCTNVTTVIPIFDHEFESANLTINTAYWSETHVEDYVDIYNNLNKVSFDYGGMDTWYYTKNVSVLSGNEYSVRAWIDVPFNSGYNKYWFCVKPTSMTIQQANNTGYLYCLDPFWNSSWDDKKGIQINGVGLDIPANYQLKIDVDYLVGMNLSFKDLRFINSTEDGELNYWIEEYISGVNATVWVKVPTISNTTNTRIYMYYGNDAVETTSEGTATFDTFDGFAGTTVNTSKWDINAGSEPTQFDVTGGLLEMYVGTGTQGQLLEKTAVSQPHIQEARVKFSSTTTNLAVLEWAESVALNNYLDFYTINVANTVKTTATASGTATQYTRTINNMDEWATYKFQWKTNEFKVFQNDSLIDTITTNVPTTDLKSHLRVEHVGSGTMYVDWIRTRKYSSVEPTYIIVLDTTPLGITVDSPINTTYYNYVVDLDVSANNTVDTWWYSLNGGVNNTFMPNTTITGIEGANNITVYANNTIGNITSLTNYFTINHQDWLDTDWGAYREFQIDGIGLDIINNYQKNLEILYYSGMDSAFKDLRFVWLNETTEQEISYWVENNVSGVNASVWVTIPEVSNTTNTTIRMYYNNTGVGTTSNGTATFLDFDDFNTDLSKWNISLGTPTIETAQSVSLPSSVYINSDDQMWRYTPETYTRDIVLEIQGMKTTASDVAQKGYLFVAYGETTEIYTILTFVSYRLQTYTPVLTSVKEVNASIWYRTKTVMRIPDNKSDFYVDDMNTPALENASVYQQDVNVGRIYIYSNSGSPNPFYADNYFIREYAETEPDYSIGAEILYTTRPPIIIISSPTNTTYNTASIDLNVSADETIDTWWYSLNGGGNNTFMPNTTITGIEGANNITVYANDTAGNVGEETEYFTVSTFVSNAVFSIALPSDYSSFTNTTGENETDATSYDWISFNFTSRPEYYVQPYQVGNAGNTQNGATQPIFLIDNTGNVNIDISFRFAESLPSGITVEGNASCSGTYTSCQSSSLQFGTSYSQLVNNLSYIDSFANITMYSNMSADASPNSTGFTMYIKGVES